MSLKITLSDVNMALKITYQTRIWPSNNLSGHDFSHWKKLCLFWLIMGWGWVKTRLRNMCTLPEPWIMSARLRRGQFLSSPACTIYENRDHIPSLSFIFLPWVQYSYLEIHISNLEFHSPSLSSIFIPLVPYSHIEIYILTLSSISLACVPYFNLEFHILT